MSPTTIEWTDETWNPVTGCTKVSEGCRNCYAERESKRFAGRFGYPEDEPFRVTQHRDKLDKPLSWRKSRMCFVCSMGDLFHPEMDYEYLKQIFAAMLIPNIHTGAKHTFQVLTKRPDMMAEFMVRLKPDDLVDIAIDIAISKWGPVIGGNDDWWKETNGPYIRDAITSKWPPPNIWMGTSIEDQASAEFRLGHLMLTNAAVRFVSCEPLLSDIDFMSQGLEFWSPLDTSRLHGGLDWVIVGGESGPGARPMHPNWVRSIRDQCQAADIPFMFKQWGAWSPETVEGVEVQVFGLPSNQCVASGDGKTNHILYTRVGKKAAGRELDGRIWDEYPETSK